MREGGVEVGKARVKVGKCKDPFFFFFFFFSLEIEGLCVWWEWPYTVNEGKGDFFLD